MQWEYNLLVQSPNTECARCEVALNGLGRDGWELVTFYVNGAGDNVFVLKNRKNNKWRGYGNDNIARRGGLRRILRSCRSLCLPAATARGAGRADLRRTPLTCNGVEIINDERCVRLRCLNSAPTADR
jgi:hypothetical protein